MWLWANDITTAWGGVPNGTLSMMFTCCPNLIFLASPWLELYRFSNWSFCYFEEFKVDVYYANFGQVKTDYSLIFTNFGQVTLILLSLGKTCREKQCKPSQFDKNSRTTPRIWQKLFSVIQSAGIQNWFSQSINRF